jgi:hypothetical protein
MDQLVQGSDVVLDGVEAPEAPALGECLERAVDAANACAGDDAAPAPTPTNMQRNVAERIAGEVHLD